MCELYAINARRPVSANDKLRLFYQDSVDHPHGWGLAWREDGRTILHKEELRAIDSRYLQRVLARPVVSANVVAHIRNATMGVLTYHNCHPFVFEDACGMTWVIAHNGTMIDGHLTKPFKEQAQGDTDSEQMALYLMDQLRSAEQHKGGPLGFDERFDVLERAMLALAPSNKLNVVIDDGTYTYVHTNTVEHTLYERFEDDAAYICTRPQDDGGDWQSVPQNRLVAYGAGRVLRVGAAHPYAIDEAAYFSSLASLGA